MFKKFRSGMILANCVALVACGGAAESESSSPSNAATSNNCSYTDLIANSERSQASACGIQVSANYAAADSGLASVVAACQRGEKTVADNYYNTTYKKMVDYAQAVSKDLNCRTSTAPTLPNNSTPTNYNFCVRSFSVSGKLTYEGSCYGPVKQGEGGCADGYSYMTQHSSLNACRTAGENWLKTR